MTKRQRDYKAEYARRTAKARREGFKGYGQKRRLLAKAPKPITGDQVLENLRKKDLLDVFELWWEHTADTLEGALSDRSAATFWTMFRAFYDRGTAT